MLGALAAWAATGCVLAPAARREERLHAVEAGRAWEPAVSDRVLPDLPPDPSWRDILERAMLANGELEAAYWEWRAAIERIDVAAGYPNTNVALGFEYLFSGGNVKGWDRSTLTVGFDPMQNLSFPTKTMASGRVAFADARAAGKRFESAKFDLQRRVLTAWSEYALVAEKLRLQRESVALRRLFAATAEGRVVAGGVQQEWLRAETDLALADDASRRLEAELSQRQARLNALLARPPDAPLCAPTPLPAPRRLPSDDTQLVQVAMDGNPELAALGYEVEARDDAVDRARQELIPDLNPFAGFEGSMAQIAGIVVSLPARIPIILGQVREARAMLRRAEAARRQARMDRTADFVATLAALRDLDRQALLLEGRIVPSAMQAAANARAAYESATLDMSGLLAAEQLVLELRTLLAEARTARETRLAELEALAGADVETLDAPGIATRAVVVRRAS